MYLIDKQLDLCPLSETCWVVDDGLSHKDVMVVVDRKDKRGFVFESLVPLLAV